MKKIIKKMKNTWQFENKQTIFDHGLSVKNEYKRLIQQIKTNLKEDDIPVFYYNKDIMDKLYKQSRIENLLIFHDIGKPFCYSKDNKG